MIEQAETLGVLVNVWLVGTAYAADSQSAPLMKELAERTNGSFFLYTGLEFLPDLEESLQPLWYYYDVGYPSQVSHPGDHTFLSPCIMKSLELRSGNPNL